MTGVGGGYSKWIALVLMIEQPMAGCGQVSLAKITANRDREQKPRKWAGSGLGNIHHINMDGTRLINVAP